MSLLNRIHLKIKVKNDIYYSYRKIILPGLNNICVNKLAPLEINFLLKSQPCTPPPPIYLVPVTISKFWDLCFSINS